MFTFSNIRVTHRIRAIGSLVFGLVVASGSTLAVSATVYVTVDGAISTHPTVIADSVSFASASAELSPGLFKASGEGTRNQTSGNVTAGILAPGLLLTNSGQAGRLYPSVRVVGDYLLDTFDLGFGGGSRAIAFARLSVKQGGDTYVTQATHTVTKVFDGDGTLLSTDNEFVPAIAAGGNLIVAESSLDRLDMTLIVPSLTIAPGTSVQLWFELRVHGSSTVGIGAADFSNSAQLSLVHDPGVVLGSDAGAPLGWITPVPEPGIAWLLGAGLVLLSFGYRMAIPRDRHT